VIDGIELHAFDKTQQMRKLECDRSAGLERRLQSTREIVGIRHVGVDIVADAERRSAGPWPKNSLGIGMPSRSAAAAVLAVGSMPRHGIRAATKFRNRYP